MVAGRGGLGVVVLAGLVSPPSLVRCGASVSESAVKSGDVKAWVSSDAARNLDDMVCISDGLVLEVLEVDSFENWRGASGGSSGSPGSSSSVACLVLGCDCGRRTVVAWAECIRSRFFR